MRYVIMATALVLALAFDSASRADAAEWCARYNDGSTNCGFHTLRQCRASVSGTGGFCNRNPAWHPRRYRY
jgi:hypothetical protein